MNIVFSELDVLSSKVLSERNGRVWINLLYDILFDCKYFEAKRIVLKSIVLVHIYFHLSILKIQLPFIGNIAGKEVTM